MSTLSDLFASLWAAVWLRGRLLGIRVRRLLGRGPDAGTAGPDYHLTKAETPAEGVDYAPIDLPPELRTRLDAARADLLAHAPGTIPGHAPRRRRRTASLAMASLLTLSVVAGGASAVMTGSTGVPAVDRALGIYEAGVSKPEASKRSGPSGSDLQPDSSEASTSIEISPSEASDSPITITFYVARDGRVCTTLTTDAASRAAAAYGCVSPADLEERLETDDAAVLGIRTSGDTVVLVGFVRDRVAKLHGDGPSGSLDVRLGQPWAPELAGLRPLKPFVATGSTDSSATTPAGPEFPPSLDIGSYVFEAVANDGSRTRIAP